jgi:RNA polymerase sigma-70 factor (ECF subfamily)
MNVKAEEFERLYIAERSRLERQLRRKVKCPATACDLVQDVFLRLWEKATERRDCDSAYLTRSARNAAIDHGRAERRRRNFFGGIVSEQYVAPEPTPFDIVAARDDLRSIEDAIGSLTKKTRHVFLLNRVHGKSFTEIAEVMGISVRAVAKHMARAMAVCESVSNKSV